MAQEEGLRSITLNADDSLAVYTGVPGMVGSPNPNYGKQYRFVKVTGSRKAGLADADDVVVGVLQSKPQVVGQEATIGIRGVSNVMVGEVLNPGDLVVSDAEGRAVKAGAGATALGVVIESTAKAANQLASVLLRIN